MKAVLISIHPEWCELIASGKKTDEVRKTRPKIETPFKCYIYQTKYRWLCNLLRTVGKDYLAEYLEMSNSKVIGEFVCDKIEEYRYDALEMTYWFRKIKHPTSVDEEFVKGTCLSYEDVMKYCKGMKYSTDENTGEFLSDIFYGWHISDLVIYTEPKELYKFCKPCDRQPGCDCNYCIRHSGNKPILRPPQSWCYVESL